ncbi:MAG: hypothetical protein II117_04210 [Clostridia bacterium]|nr:hypothetical protein [Clostridia bacterium]
MKKVFVWLLLAMLLVSSLACKAQPAEEPKSEAPAIADGTYRVEVTLTGGTGKAKIESPAALTVANGKITLTVKWSSDKYDYMLVDGEKFTPEYVDGHSVFEIPVASLETPLSVVADTTAMSAPHEIEYAIAFDAATLAPAS